MPQPIRTLAPRAPCPTHPPSSPTRVQPSSHHHLLPTLRSPITPTPMSAMRVGCSESALELRMTGRGSESIRVIAFRGMPCAAVPKTGRSSRWSTLSRGGAREGKHPRSAQLGCHTRHASSPCHALSLHTPHHHLECRSKFTRVMNASELAHPIDWENEARCPPHDDDGGCPQSTPQLKFVALGFP